MDQGSIFDFGFVNEQLMLITAKKVKLLAWLFRKAS